MDEIMVDKMAGVRMSNDVGASAEGLWYEAVPDTSACGSEAVTTVTGMVAEAYRSQTRLIRSWICDDANQALAAINDLWDTDQCFVATFRQFGL